MVSKTIIVTEFLSGRNHFDMKFLVFEFNEVSRNYFIYNFHEINISEFVRSSFIYCFQIFTDLVSLF